MNANSNENDFDASEHNHKRKQCLKNQKFSVKLKQSRKDAYCLNRECGFHISTHDSNFAKFVKHYVKCGLCGVVLDDKAHFKSHAEDQHEYESFTTLLHACKEIYQCNYVGHESGTRSKFHSLPGVKQHLSMKHQIIVVCKSFDFEKKKEYGCFKSEHMISQFVCGHKTHVSGCFNSNGSLRNFQTYGNLAHHLKTCHKSDYWFSYMKFGEAFGCTACHGYLPFKSNGKKYQSRVFLKHLFDCYQQKHKVKSKFHKNFFKCQMLSCKFNCYTKRQAKRHLKTYHGIEYL